MQPRNLPRIPCQVAATAVPVSSSELASAASPRAEPEPEEVEVEALREEVEALREEIEALRKERTALLDEIERCLAGRCPVSPPPTILFSERTIPGTSDFNRL